MVSVVELDHGCADVVVIVGLPVAATVRPCRSSPATCGVHSVLFTKVMFTVLRTVVVTAGAPAMDEPADERGTADAPDVGPQNALEHVLPHDPGHVPSAPHLPQPP